MAKGASKVNNLRIPMKKGSIQTASTKWLAVLGSQTIDESLANSILNHPLPKTVKTKPPMQSKQKSIELSSTKKLSKKIAAGILSKNSLQSPSSIAAAKAL
jgi:hypothetical protein